MLVCNKCSKEIQYLLSKEKICKCCLNKRRREYTAKRKEIGRPIKVTKMSKEYFSKKNKEWALANKEKIRKYAQDAKQRNPEKARARMLLNSAVKSGKILKYNCKVCGSEKSEAHHPDYNKPLDVVWFCRAHHIEEHKKEAKEL